MGGGKGLTWNLKEGIASNREASTVRKLMVVRVTPYPFLSSNQVMKGMPKKPKAGMMLANAVKW